MIGSYFEPLAHLSDGYLLITAIVMTAGFCIALWTLRALRGGLKTFLQRAVPVWFPFAGVYGFLSSHNWPVDLKIVCSISVGFPVGLLLLAAVRGR